MIRNFALAMAGMACLAGCDPLEMAGADTDGFAAQGAAPRQPTDNSPCEVKQDPSRQSNMRGDTTCYEGEKQTGSADDFAAFGIAALAIGLAGGGDIGGATALLAAAEPLTMDTDGVEMADECTPGPKCEAARNKVRNQLSTWQSASQGRGPGMQYGYAWCGSEATARAAAICSNEFKAAGETACANTLAVNYNEAKSAAQSAIAEGRNVGVDARSSAGCTP